MSISIGMRFEMDLVAGGKGEFLVVALFPFGERNVAILRADSAIVQSRQDMTYDNDTIPFYVEQKEEAPGFELIGVPDEDIAFIQQEYNRLLEEHERKAQEPPTIVITMDGGLIKNVMTEFPARVVVIDYDAEDADEDEITEVFGNDAVVQEYPSEQHPDFEILSKL